MTVGLVVAAATPQSIVGLLHSQIEQILGHPEVKERLAGLGFDINVSSQQAFAARIKAEFAMWSNLARDAHIKLE